MCMNFLVIFKIYQVCEMCSGLLVYQIPKICSRGRAREEKVENKRIFALHSLVGSHYSGLHLVFSEFLDLPRVC